MSKYTTELRYICEDYAGLDKSEGYNSISDIIANSRNKVFDFSYPIFDESYRSVLETKIIKHFYTREICTETVGQWKHFLDMRMNEIMPYYNKLYESELIEFNPIYDVDLTRDHNKEVNGTKGETGSFTEIDSTDAESVGTSTDTVNTQSVTNGTANGTRNLDGTKTLTGTTELESTKDTDGTTTNTGTENLTDNDKLNRWDTYQDTPQGGLTGVQLENYLTNARHITEDKTGSTKVSTNNSTNNIDTTEETNSTETTNNTETTDNAETSQSTENTTLNSTQTSNGRTTDSNAIDTNKSGSHTTNEILKDLEDYVEHVKGKSGGVSYSKLLNEFRETFLNIDALIISDLRDLFFNLW